MFKEMNLWLKALLIGLVFAVMGLVVSTLLMLMQPGFKWSKYHFWPSVALSFFVSGVLFYGGSKAMGISITMGKTSVHTPD